MFQNIVITGASSGIGKALALRYARPGAVLGIAGRHRERLGDVAGLCRGLGAEPETAVVDVTDRALMRGWLEDFDLRFPVDLVIANAGVLHGEAEDGALEGADESFALFETNVAGVLNTLHPLLPRMIERRSGHICIISSIAGFIPLSQSPSYSASKAAVTTYGLALRAALRPHGVKVTVICPGYVTTPMTERLSGHKPFEMPVDKAVERIVYALERNRSLVTFPFFFASLTRIGGLLPDSVRRWTSKPFRFTVSK
jgi:short-subunit dehydrogenase